MSIFDLSSNFMVTHYSFKSLDRCHTCMHQLYCIQVKVFYIYIENFAISKDFIEHFSRKEGLFIE